MECAAPVRGGRWLPDQLIGEGWGIPRGGKLCFRVKGSVCGVQGLGFQVSGLGFRV